jgi:isopentenyldiphosphate isomerase
MKGVSLDEQQVMQFRKMLQRMFLIFLIHTLLVFYSAFFMSNKAWAFISGGMFYLLFIAIVGYEFLNRKIKQKKEATVEPEEWLPLVDEKGTDIGRAPRSACHQGEKLLHPVVHLHVLNQHKHIFLQKRPLNKLIQPGKWDTAVGGHISLGETLETALKREAYEEIGLKNFSAKLVKTYKWETEIETELVYVFVTYNYQTIHLHSPEVEEGKFWTPHQILHETGNQTFTPNFEYEYQLLKNLYFK